MPALDPLGSTRAAFVCERVCVCVCVCVCVYVIPEVPTLFSQRGVWTYLLLGRPRGECSAAGGRLRPLSRLIPSNRLAAPYRVVSPSIGSSKLLSETIWRLFAACQLFLVSYFTIT